MAPANNTAKKPAAPVNNGVNVEALLGAREALTKAPEAAQVQVARRPANG